MHGNYEKFTKFWLEDTKRINHLGDVSINRRILLKWILEKENMMVWTNIN
jgi:hypothetical protein